MGFKYGRRLRNLIRDKIQRQQLKILRSIVKADWYTTNRDIHKNLGMKTIIEECSTASRKYYAKIAVHQSAEMRNLPHEELTNRRRLKRKRPLDLL